MTFAYLQDNLAKWTNPPVDFFQSSTNYFNWKELKEFVTDIKWRVENQIPEILCFQEGIIINKKLPNNSGKEQLIVIFERSKDGFTKKKVCKDASCKDDQHGGCPEGKRVFSGEGEGTWSAEECCFCSFILNSIQTIRKVISNSQTAESSMSQVEVWVHLQLGHLVGEVQKCLRIHVEGLFWAVVSNYNPRPLKC